MNSSPAISVVVCSLNGARKIGACLEALADQSVGDRMQLVVVDDGSSDGTAEVARRYTDEVHSHGINRGLSAARNTGIGLARGPIIAFTDDDCIPEPTWLEQLLIAHETPGVIGAGGPVEIAGVRTIVHRYLAEYPPLAPLELDLQRHSSFLGRLALYLARTWFPSKQPVGPRAVYSFPGANMSFKKRALETVGGFNPKQKFGSDDEYICDRVRERFGLKALWFEPGAVVRHNYEGTFSDVARRNYAYGRGHAQAYLEDPGRRWPIVFPLPFVLIGMLWLLRRSPKGLLVPVAVPLAYPQGVTEWLTKGRMSDISFSWLRLIEEASHNVGMLAGLICSGQRPAGGRAS
ncbi:MAG TPA: glycosyltransferase [Acidimicrobiales bacterium]|nr:glycosyltransferase [Acidimicrobiales bacterium]